MDEGPEKNYCFAIKCNHFYSLALNWEKNLKKGGKKYE